MGPLSLIISRMAQPQFRRRRPRHAEFLGLPFSLLQQPEVIRMIAEQGGAPYRYIVTPNAHHVVTTGSDLVAAVLAALNASASEHTPRRILIVGPQRAAEDILQRAYPNLTFAVMPAPGALAKSADRRLAVARACMNRAWDIVLLCVGSPAQELIARELDVLGCKSGIALCVGASIDFLTGKSVRAPRWLQKMGFEWAYRLIREPARLWRRYLVESPKIFRIFMAERTLRAR
jgi:exopolysaccharide biosynthesis WecB/TagA/CpsF family protein